MMFEGRLVLDQVEPISDLSFCEIKEWQTRGVPTDSNVLDLLVDVTIDANLRESTCIVQGG